MPEVLFNISNKFNYCEDYLNVEFSYLKPRGEDIFYKKGFYQGKWVTLGQDENGNWEYVSKLPGNVRPYNKFVLDICLPNQNAIKWSYYLKIDKR